MQKQAELISLETRARGSIAGEMIFVFFNHQLHITATTVSSFIYKLAAGTFQAGNNKTSIGAELVIFSLDNDTVGLDQDFDWWKNSP